MKNQRFGPPPSWPTREGSRNAARGTCGKNCLRPVGRWVVLSSMAACSVLRCCKKLVDCAPPCCQKILTAAFGAVRRGSCGELQRNSPSICGSKCCMGQICCLLQLVAPLKFSPCQQRCGVHASGHWTKKIRRGRRCRCRALSRCICGARWRWRRAW